MSSGYAMVFPGQGSQSEGLLSELAERSSLIQETFEEASEILKCDYWALAQQGSMSELSQTTVTQPLMLIADVAVYRYWSSLVSVKPQLVAGHSLGEYAALVCAGALSFGDALQVVSVRAEAMHSAVPEGTGAVAAILGLSAEDVDSVCAAVQAEHPEHIVSSANLNALGQTVIAGHRPAVEDAMARAKQGGAKIAKLIPVSVPVHCPLMAPSQPVLAEALAQVNWLEKDIPVLHNVDVSEHTDVSETADLLVQQLVKPVRWVETIQEMGRRVSVIVECGPGQVLRKLVKRIDSELVSLATATPDLFDQSVKVIEEKSVCL
jgi:[acyl-carrier-protein] S-malonyltransferase